MNIFGQIKEAKITNSHGEVNFLLIANGDINLEGFVDVTPEPNGTFIVGHSESGHHHLLEADGVNVKERISDGMKILYALVDKPVALRQEAGSPHKQQIIQPGAYLITNNSEYDPFTEQARRVAD